MILKVWPYMVTPKLFLMMILFDMVISHLVCKYMWYFMLYTFLCYIIWRKIGNSVGWLAHRSCLTHLSLVCSLGPSVVLCALSIANSTIRNWPIVSLLILFYFILFSNVICGLEHDCTLCFTGSPCYSVSYYNYISIWPFCIVIHLI